MYELSESQRRLKATGRKGLWYFYTHFYDRRGKCMKIPEKIKVLYKEYIVEETANLHDEAGDLYGQIQFIALG